MRRRDWLFAGLVFAFLCVWMTQDVQQEQARLFAYYPATTQVDTTYADNRFAYLVRTISADTVITRDTLGAVVDTFVRTRVNGADVGSSVRYLAIQGPGDSAIVLSYDTLPLAVLDSAAVDSIYAAWGIEGPAAYLVQIPEAGPEPPGGGGGNPGDLADGDLGQIYAMTVQDSQNVATLLGFAYENFPVDSTTVSLLGEQQGDVWWNFRKWADTMYVKLHDDVAVNYSAVFDHQHWDRAKSLYSFWWMTGEGKWKKQADSTLWVAFVKYYEPNTCHIPPQRMLPEGMWAYYFTHRNDPDSQAVADTMLWCNRRISERLRSIWIDDYGDPTNPYDDSRIQARTSQWAMTMALFDSTDYAGRDWQSIGPVLGYDSLMSFHELKATATPGVMHLDEYSGCAPPWQLSASPLHVLIDRERWFGDLTATQVDSIEATVGGLADTLANTSGLYLAQVDPTYTQKGFKYQIGCASESGDGSPALNIFGMIPMAWEFRATGDSSYWRWAIDSLLAENHDYGLFCGGNPGPCGTVPGGRNWWYGRGSEFNQAFYNFWEVLIWLDEG